ncbi:unnamed protein product, partial [Prorocentrum cordatum]
GGPEPAERHAEPELPTAEHTPTPTRTGMHWLRSAFPLAPARWGHTAGLAPVKRGLRRAPRSGGRRGACAVPLPAAGTKGPPWHRAAASAKEAVAGDEDEDEDEEEEEEEEEEGLLPGPKPDCGVAAGRSWRQGRSAPGRLRVGWPASPQGSSCRWPPSRMHTQSDSIRVNST